MGSIGIILSVSRTRENVDTQLKAEKLKEREKEILLSNEESKIETL